MSETTQHHNAEPKWTPGPWHWVEDRFRGGYTGLFAADDTPVIYPQRANDGDDGAAWFDTNSYNVGEQALEEADARLIAASPDMYVALEKAVETIRALHGVEAWDIYNQHSPEMVQIAAALKKARGEV